MATKRDEAYVWVTWITKLIAGEENCLWKLWFRANYKFDKLPGDFNLAKWQAEHTLLSDETVSNLRDMRYTVSREGQNSFNVKGRSGVVLAGRADIVAVKNDDAVVIDCKTGSQKSSDIQQVLVYMFFLPQVHPQLKGRKLRGEVYYKTGDIVRVPDNSLDNGFRQQLGRFMMIAADPCAPEKTPSFSECRFCDVRKEDCPERVEAESDKILTDIF